MNISAIELPNFIRKYYLLHELLIFKYWRHNISVSNIALHTAVRHSCVQRSSPQSTWDSASVNSWNTRLHHSNSVATGQPTVLTLTRSTTRIGGSCSSVCTAARFMTSTSWSRAWSKRGNIFTRWSSINRSGIGVHVSELAFDFEHTVDILNTDFRCAEALPFTQTHTWQSITRVPIVDTYAFGWLY